MSETMPSPIVQLTDISVRFGTNLVLDQVSLTLYQGKITTVIGPNGAGKSTLVNVLIGLQQADAGQVVHHQPLKIGYVPQKLSLNAAFPLSVRGLLTLTCPDQEKQRSTLAWLGAEHLADASIHDLSGGEMQRVLLAKALLNDPNLLVLDEPAQGVDMQGQIELYELIQDIRQQRGCAVFMISHDLHFVMAKTDEVLCLYHHICCSGAPEDITQHPTYQKLFGYPISEQLALYHHHHGHHHNLAGGVSHD